MTEMRCIHRAEELCPACSWKATRETLRSDDSHWISKDGGESWVYNPDLKFGSVDTIHYNGPAHLVAVEGVRIKPNYPNEPYAEQARQYDGGNAVDQTIQQMSTILTNDEIHELRTRLASALNNASEWHRIANDSLQQQKAMSKRHHEQMDQVNRDLVRRAATPILHPKTTEMRVGDTERNAYIEHLGNMFGDGHLSQDEFSERSDKANAAKTLSELRPLVADLPPMPTVPAVRVAPLKQPVPRRPLTVGTQLIAAGIASGATAPLLNLFWPLTSAHPLTEGMAAIGIIMGVGMLIIGIILKVLKVD